MLATTTPTIEGKRITKYCLLQYFLGLLQQVRLLLLY